MTKAFIPSMAKKGRGHIVCMCSSSSLIGPASMLSTQNTRQSPYVIVLVLLDYGASKWANLGFMEALEHDYKMIGNEDIDFTSICPGFVNTPLVADLP